MKNRLMKRILAATLAVLLGITTLGSSTIKVKAEPGENLTDEQVQEATTEQITLKVGEAFGLSTENIDKLLAESGYDYASTAPTIYYDERVEMDTAYLVPASGVGVVDAAGGKTIEMLYVTDEEFGDLFEQWQSGALDKQYGTEVLLVDEAEGYCYYARAEKNGSTTITISEYEIEGGTIAVKIPVLIQSVSQEGGDEEVKVEDVITSTTDESIVIDNTNGILAAGTTLETAKVENGETFETAKELIAEVNTTGQYAVYELNLFDADRAEIHQLDGKIKVTMELPFKIGKGCSLEVYRVDGDKLIECASSVKDGKVTFETDHFSTYIFNEVKEVPKTGDVTDIYLYVTILMAGGIMLILANKSKRNA